MTSTVAESENTAVIHALGEEFEPRTSGQQRAVGWLFGGTGLALFALMALIGLAMRFAQADSISISAEWFYRLMTLHAAGMLAGALLAMMGGLWLVVRSSVPALNFGRAMASYAAIVSGAVLIVVAVLIGGFAAGWTFLYPLPFDSSGQWETWAAITFLIGMGLVGVGFFVYCIDVLKATTQTYGGLLGALAVNWLRGRDSSGGGYGDPLTRDPARVRIDVLEGWESLTKARDIYGVIFVGEIDDDSLTVDADATRRRRAELAAMHRSAAE